MKWIAFCIDGWDLFDAKGNKLGTLIIGVDSWWAASLRGNAVSFSTIKDAAEYIIDTVKRAGL